MLMNVIKHKHRFKGKSHMISVHAERPLEKSRLLSWWNPRVSRTKGDEP